MSRLHLVWAGAWRRPGRTVLTALSVATVFALFGMLQGLITGLATAAGQTRADVLFISSRVSQIEPLPMGHLDQIRRVPGVTVATAQIAFPATYRTDAQNVAVVAIEPATFFAVYRDWRVAADQLQALKRTGAGVLVGSDLARRFGWKIGDRILLKSLIWANRDGAPNWTFDVVGFYDTPSEPTRSNMLLANFSYVDEGRLVGLGTATSFIVRVADPRQADVVAATIDRLFANSPHETKTSSEKQMAQSQLKQIGAIGLIVVIVMGSVFLAMMLSVATVMMQSVNQRIPELAVLKVLGFSDGEVLRLIFAEAVVFCLVSAGLGLAIAAALFPLAKPFIGIAALPPPVVATGLGLAVLLGLVTGFTPAWRGMRLQIVDALAGR